MPTTNDFDIIVKAIMDEASLKDIKGKIAKVQQDVIKETTKVTVKDVGIDELGKSFDATYILNQEKQLITTTRDYASASKRATQEAKKQAFELEKLAKAEQRVSQQTSTINNKFEAFSNKLLSAKNSGTITEEQFTALSSSLNNIKNDFNNSSKNVQDFDKVAFKSQDGLTKLNNKLGQYTAETKRAATNTTSLGDAIQKFTQWYLVAGVVTALIRKIKDIVTQVKLLDSALVELNKVTDLNASQLDKYVDSAFRLGEQLRTTGVEVINASTEFARAGYTAKEALDLSEVAIKLTNVAEGINDTGEASNVLISVLKGMGIEFEDFNDELAMANGLLDKLNEVANNNAISFDNLASMVQGQTATLSTLGNELNEIVSLLTGAYEVLQDTRVAKGISTIGLRIAGLNEDLSEEVGLASQVGDALKKYAGIDVFDEQTKQLRSTYDILEELASKWDGLTKNAQAYLTTTVAGKNRADVLNAIMQNWEGVQSAMEDATNSLGSADKEMEAYYDSIDAHLQSFNNTWQELSTNFMQSDFVKFIIDSGTWLLNLVESLGGLQTVLFEIITLIAIVKLDSIIKGTKTLFSNISNLITSMTTFRTKVVDVTGQVQVMTTSLQMAQMIMGALTLAISSGILIYNKWKQAEEEKQRAIEESYTNAIQNYEQEMDVLSELENRYFDLYNRNNKTESQKEQLIELTKDLAKAYGLEYEALAKLNGETATAEEVYEASIQKKIDALKEQTSGMQQAVDIAQNELNKSNLYNINKMATIGLSDDIYKKFDIFSDSGEKITGWTGSSSGGYNFTGNMEEYLNFLKEVRDYYNSIENREKPQEELLAEINKDIGELQNTVDEYNSKVSEYKTSYSTLSFYEELSDEIVSLQTKINDFNNSSLQEQADSYMQIKNRLDELINKYPEYANTITGIFEGFYEQVEVLKSMDFLLDKMESELASLKELKEVRDEELEQQEKLLKVEEARAKLAEAMNKKVRVYRAGQGFVYENDYSEVQDAQEDLAEAIRNAELDDLSQAIKNLTKAIEIYNKAQEQQTSAGKNELREYFMSSANQEAFMNMDYNKKVSTLKKYAPDFDWENYLNPNTSAIDYSGWLNSSNSNNNNPSISANNTKTFNPINKPINWNRLGNGNSPLRYVMNGASNSQSSVQNIGNITLPNVSNANDFINELKRIGFVTASK